MSDLSKVREYVGGNMTLISQMETPVGISWSMMMMVMMMIIPHLTNSIGGAANILNQYNIIY